MISFSVLDFFSRIGNGNVNNHRHRLTNSLESKHVLYAWSHFVSFSVFHRTNGIWQYLGRNLVNIEDNIYHCLAWVEVDILRQDVGSDCISSWSLLTRRKPAPIAQLVECPLWGTGGHGFDPGPRHTKVVKNGTSCSSLGTQTYGVELGLVDPVSG